MFRKVVVALAGNPNSGKTTIFNHLTGARQKVGNYPGVTVERKEGFLNFEDLTLKIVDLPGTYSLTAYSLEELIARRVLIDERPDVVVNIVDASNLERNLYLTLQLLELGLPVVIALNMMDVVEKRGLRLDGQVLSEVLGVPVVTTVGHRGRGIEKLLESIKGVVQGLVPARANGQLRFSDRLEEELRRLENFLGERASGLEGYRFRWLAIKALEGDPEVKKLLQRKVGLDGEFTSLLEEVRERLEGFFGEDPETLLADARYQLINKIVSQSLKRPRVEKTSLSDKIDQVVCHRLLGLPIFLFLMWLMFQAIYSWSAPFMEGIEAFFGWLAKTVGDLIPEGLLKSLLIDGLIGGLGGVLVFLPQIVILFLFIAFLEDTGYMARAAFIMDRALSPFGLQGKSFVPLLSSFACNIPGIMATRTLESQRLRLLTILAAPFMSCAARLPIYVLFIAAFVPERSLFGVVNLQGLVLFLIYFLGILVGLFTVVFWGKTVLKGERPPFVMELPPYRLPTLKGLFIHMWTRAGLYIRKAGTIILAISVVMWLLFTFPTNPDLETDYQALREEAIQRLQTETGLSLEVLEGLLSEPQKDGATGGQKQSVLAAYSAYQERIKEIENQEAAERLEKSYAGRLGRLIEPLIRPLGFDWRIGVALTSAFAAKEVFVATMGQIYALGEVGEENPSLIESLRRDPLFSPVTAMAVMIFSLLMVPCMATLSVIRMETASWRWPALVTLWTMLVAWLLTFLWVRFAGPFWG
ncbi:ferrous iron transport protein B [Thermosulfuriphilus sp.]